MINYEVVNFIEDQCLDSFSAMTTTITNLKFSIDMTYDGIAEEEFNTDSNAQRGTVEVLSSTMHLNPDHISISGTSSNTTRRLLAPGVKTIVTYLVDVTVENLGFRSTESEELYLLLVGQMAAAVRDGIILTNLKSTGLPIYDTPLFSGQNFSIPEVSFSELQTVFVQTAVPTAVPTLSPTIFTELITENDVYLSLAVVSTTVLMAVLIVAFWCFRDKRARREKLETKYGVHDVVSTETDKTDDASKPPLTYLDDPIIPITASPNGEGQSGSAIDMLPFGAPLSSLLGVEDHGKLIGVNDSISMPSVQSKRVVLPPIKFDYSTKVSSDTAVVPGYASSANDQISSKARFEHRNTTEGEDNFAWDPVFKKTPDSISRPGRHRRYSRRSSKILPSGNTISEQPHEGYIAKPVVMLGGHKRRKNVSRRLPGPGESGLNSPDEGHQQLPTIVLSPIRKGLGPGFTDNSIERE